jgi:pimeloyl-ACP methyl ester carboxylesterase
VAEAPFEVTIAGGVLRGDRGGAGPPALLLHGGPAIPDYLGGLAAELGGLFETIRYTQRGTPPSTGGPPYTIEAHVADALAVLDAFEIDRTWAIGHSWGGHLALHLLVMHPERLFGVICIDPLGASPDSLAEQNANLRRGLSADQIAREDEIEAKRRAGDVAEAELVERWGLIWPQFFADPARAGTPPLRVGVEASIGTNRSIAEHFAQGTLARRLQEARLPALFVHGELDPMPVRSSVETASLIPDAHVEVLPARGHFPWLERPGSVRDAVARFLSAT